MAEAHNAAALSFSVSHDGVSLSYDQELLRDIWHSFVRAYKRRFYRFKNDFTAGIFPANPKSMFFMVILITGLYMIRVDVTFGLIPLLRKMINYCCVSDGYFVAVFSTLFASIVSWFLAIQCLRLSLKMLLSYKKYMYERQGVVTLRTKLFMGVLHVISKCGPLMHSFQGALPHLPLPSLNQTLEKHLKSVRPMYDDDEYEQVVELTTKFQKGIGRRLQRYLVLKSWLSVNWVTDWWEEFVYLRGRTPIMVNSNYYGLDCFYPFSRLTGEEPNQASRAANTTIAALKFRQTIERAEVKPFPVSAKPVPLCTIQYERLFNCTRIPGEECDALQVTRGSKHIAVLHKGRWFRLRIHTGRRLASVKELEQAFEQILNDTSEPLPGERNLAAMTAGDRTPWARARRDYFSRGVNKTSLHCIEKAAFVMVLDENDVNYDEYDTSLLDKWAHVGLHGDGNNRWFDKSFTLVVSRNARVCANFEHSWGDAAVASHFLEEMFTRDLEHIGYTKEGKCHGQVEVKLDPQRLNWDLSDDCQQVIDAQLVTARALIDDVEMRLLVWRKYGKGYIKKLKVSPDAFLQMAIQLTYYRDQGHFCLTYESSMTRLYREGRTETVRSCTMAAKDFVLAMCDPEETRERRATLLHRAAEEHVANYLDAMCGQGIDRHLFGLYVIKRYLEEESPFLDKIFPPTYLLSTSQTPIGQTGVNFSECPQMASCGGGFGPVAEAGYGVSYVVAGEHIISFHISSKRSAPNTDSSRFRKTLVQSLHEMHELMSKEELIKLPKSPSTIFKQFPHAEGVKSPQKPDSIKEE